MSVQQRHYKLGEIVFGSLVCLPLVVTGCIKYPDADPVQRQCMAHITGEPDPAHIKRPSGTVVLKRIRFTDDGELVKRCELTDALNELQVNSAQIIVLYVHGWKHNAEESDADLKAFDLLLRSLRATEEHSSDPRQVVGIFIGWNGRATDIPVLKELSFWGRKRAADRLAESGALTKLIGAMAHVRKLYNQSRDLVVFIGHSFGARILFSATSGLLLYESQMRHPGRPGSAYDIIGSPADIVILLNPAFEALRYTSLDAIRRHKERFSNQLQPVLITIATNNDWATSIAFPIGQWLGMEGRNLERTSLGNYEPYFTHELVPINNGTPVHGTRGNASWYDIFCEGGVCLRRNDDFSAGNPFLVARTNQTILNGHNGIWTDPFLRWLTSFLKQVDMHKAPF